jgi:hypothetical protein
MSEEPLQKQIKIVEEQKSAAHTWISQLETFQHQLAEQQLELNDRETKLHRREMAATKNDTVLATPESFLTFVVERHSGVKVEMVEKHNALCNRYFIYVDPSFIPRDRRRVQLKITVSSMKSIHIKVSYSFKVSAMPTPPVGVYYPNFMLKRGEGGLYYITSIPSEGLLIKPL